MQKLLLRARNSVNHFVYTQMLKRIFFLINPEQVYDYMVRTGETLYRHKATRSLIKFKFGLSMLCSNKPYAEFALRTLYVFPLEDK